MRHRCPVCFYDDLPYPPADYHICPCCGTEFGTDDAEAAHQQLREEWIDGGAKWFFGTAPEHWKPWHQLIESGYDFKFRIHQPSGIERFTSVTQEPNEIPRLVPM